MQRFSFLFLALMLFTTSIYADDALYCIGGAHIDDIFILKKSSVMENANHAILKTYVGGVAYNMAHLLKRKYDNVAMLSIVGQDIAGDHVLQTLKSEGIDGADIIRDPKFRTTVYSAFHNPDGDLQIAAIDKTIYSNLTAEQLKPKISKLTKAKAWVLDSTFQPEFYEYLASIKNKPMIFTTICSVGEVPQIMPILSSTDVLFGNVDEMSLMANNQDKSDAGIWHSLEVIAKKGVKTVVCTHGPNGIYVLSNGKQYRMAALPTTIVESTNGAGDALAAGVISAIVNGKPLEQALHSGLSAAAAQLAKKDW